MLEFKEALGIGETYDTWENIFDSAFILKMLIINIQFTSILTITKLGDYFQGPLVIPDLLSPDENIFPVNCHLITVS